MSFNQGEDLQICRRELQTDGDASCTCQSIIWNCYSHPISLSDAKSYKLSGIVVEEDMMSH